MQGSPGSLGKSLVLLLVALEQLLGFYHHALDPTIPREEPAEDLWCSSS